MPAPCRWTPAPSAAASAEVVSAERTCAADQSVWRARTLAARPLTCAAAAEVPLSSCHLRLLARGELAARTPKPSATRSGLSAVPVLRHVVVWLIGRAACRERGWKDG